MVKLKPGELMKRLYEGLRNQASKRTIAGVYLGSTYLAVCLDDGRLGLSAVPVAKASPGEESLPLPLERLKAVGAESILAWCLAKDTPLQKAIALATANALISPGRSDAGGDAFDLIGLVPGDRVVMVGRFTPLIDRIAASGAALTVLEKDPAKGLVLPPRERRVVLQCGDVALITATTLLYDSLEEILSDLSAPRHVAVLGPSTPMLAELFDGAPVHHLGGIRVTEASKIIPLIVAGSGTRAMRPHMEMTNIFLKGK